MISIIISLNIINTASEWNLSTDWDGFHHLADNFPRALCMGEKS